jgi:sugar/nucleoside kinase (ribokinase family)
MRIDILFLGGTSIDLIQNAQNKNKRLSFFAATGGSITNSAVIAAKLGLKVALLSKVGKDSLGDFAVNSLRSHGVNTRGILRDPKFKTSLAIAQIDKKGNSTYTFYKPSPKESIVPLKNISKNLLDGCKIFHFGSSFSYQEDSSQEALKYVKYLKKRGTFVSMDPNFRPYAIKDKTGAKKRVLSLLKLVNLAKLSELDVEFLTGQKDPLKGLKTLKNRLSCEIILTLGAKGSIYIGKSKILTKIPAIKVKVVDTIGAGDAYTAGLLYRIRTVGEKAFFMNIKSHLSFASATSALICTKKGANKALKGLSQVKKFLS